MTERVRAAVVGATGYIGMQCVGLLDAHPGVELALLVGRSSAGQRFADVVPGSNVQTVVVEDGDWSAVDVVFAALPHTVAAQRAKKWIADEAVVIDMSADFRFRDAGAYEREYKTGHPAPDLCATAVYALPELGREKIRDAALIAAPGCYPTATLLATWPAVSAGLVENDLIVDAKSGVSGAGRSPSLTTHFGEVNESTSAYSVARHRHKAEMLQQLRIADANVSLTFVPHLVPMTRGILATAYLRPSPNVAVSRIEETYRTFCGQHHFLRYSEMPPSTKSVSGSNVAALNVTEQDGVAVITCAIDNLVKGAAGQAVQAFNIRFGFDEDAGLEGRTSWP